MREENNIGYVYRFLDKDKNVLYVGRTTNMNIRFNSHEHLTEKVKGIEYIRCSEADMYWKEIYYINLYNSKYLENKSHIGAGDVTDLNINDRWYDYKKCDNGIEYQYLYNKYEYLVDNPPKYNYKELIRVTNHKWINMEREQEQGKFINSMFSQAWFRRSGKNTIDQCKNNLTNYFRKVAPKETTVTNKNRLWTTFPELYNDLKNKGYTKDYVKLDGELKTNTDKTVVAFVMNMYVMEKTYSDNRGNNNNNDRFALTMLLCFLFKSALKDGKPITLYLPSKRMRRILDKWINTHSTE